MATTLSLSFCPLDPQHHHIYTTTHFKPHHTPPFFTTSLTPKPKQPPPPPLTLPKFKSNRSHFTPSFSTSHSSSSTSSNLEDPLRTGRFLTNDELEKLRFLENFRYTRELKSGSMWVRVMREEELDATVGLLSESFAESMLLPLGYVTLLGFLVKQYLIERRALMPHTATLIGFYRAEEGGAGEEEEEQLAGTVEISFDKMGANSSPPTPTPPKNSPYVCNMTVKKPLRRKGIGWHLLKASEELISQMSSSREVYLHCRMIDSAPFNMYTKAGYNIVKTDSIFILLTLQRRKHLMCKKLPILNSPSEMDISGSDMELPS